MQKYVRQDLLENVESYMNQGTVFVKIKEDYIFYRLKGKTSEEVLELGNKITAETLIFEQQAKREQAIYSQTELETKELLLQQATSILESIIGNKNICPKERIKLLKEVKKIF